MNRNPLLGGGPKRFAKDLQFGDWIMLRKNQWASRAPWRVNHASDFIQITDHEYSFSKDVKTLSFEELDQLTWDHYAHDAPIWLTIITFGLYKLERY